MARSFAAASSQFLYVASNLGITAEPFTFACWGQSSDAANNQNLMAFSRSASDSGVYLLAMRGSVAGDPIAAIKQNDAGTASAFANTTTGYSTGSWHSACAVFESTTSRTASIDGGSSGTNTNSVSAVTGFEFSIGAAYPRLTTRAYLSGYVAFPAVWNVALSAAEVLMLAKGAHPFSVRPDNLIAFWPLDEKTGGARDIVGGYDLTASASEPTWVPDPPVLVRRPRRSKVWMGSDGVVNGTLARTLSADTLSASGTALYTGTVAVSLSGDTISASGAVLVAGAAAATLGADTLSASATATVSGTLAQTLGGDTVGASGAVGISGALAATVAADTASAAGAVTVSGTLSRGLSADTLSASGSIGDAMSGTLAVTMAPDTMEAYGITKVSGAVVATLGIDALAAFGTVHANITGTLSITLAPDVLTSYYARMPPFSASLSSLGAAATLSSASSRAILSS